MCDTMDIFAPCWDMAFLLYVSAGYSLLHCECASYPPPCRKEPQRMSLFNWHSKKNGRLSLHFTSQNKFGTINLVSEIEKPFVFVCVLVSVSERLGSGR